MRRRTFIAALGGVAALPLAARAQQAMPVVGFIRITSLANFGHLVSAFRQGLAEAGFVEGRNVVIELQSADAHPERDRKSTRLNSSHIQKSRMPSSA